MSLSIRAITTTLSWIAFVLVVAGWATQYYAWLYVPDEFMREDCHGVIRLFSLNRGGNLPSWFQSTLLLACSFLLRFIYNGDTSKESKTRWGVLSLVFLFLSLDEAAAIHAGITDRLFRVLNAAGVLSGSRSWVFVWGILVALFGGWLWKLLGSLPRKTLHEFLIAGTLFLSGALGWELVLGWYEHVGGIRSLTYMTGTTIEELLECAGVILFLHALLSYLRLSHQDGQATMFPGSPADSDFDTMVISIRE